MSPADRPGAIFAFSSWLRTWPRRYGLALSAVCLAIAAQRGLEVSIGFSHSFLLFYPTIVMVSLLAGFMPGIVATVLCAGVAGYLYSQPGALFVVSDETEGIGLVLFVMVGITISWLADALRQRANRLQEFEKVVEGVEEMIVVVDRHHRYLIANRAFLSYTGKKREQVIGRRIIDILNPEVFETKIKAKLEACFSGQIVQFEMHYQYPNRGDRELQITYFPIGGPKGVDRVACVLRDVTEARKASCSLQLFRALIDHSNDAVEVVDPDTLRFLDVNQKACEDLGYTREELLGLSVPDIDTRGKDIGLPEAMQVLRATGSIVRESIHQRKDGSAFPVEISIRYVELERRYLVTVARDISDRKESERALRESEDRYRDLIEHSEDLVCTHDLTGKLLSVNPASARLLGYDASELMEMSMRQLVAPEFRAQFDQYLERIRTNGTDRGFLCVVAKDGRRRIWEYRNSLRTEGVPSPIVRGIARDVTERLEAEEALRRSEQRMRLFIEHAPVAAALLDRDMRYVQASRRWRDDYRLGDRELMGISHYEIFPEIPERWKEAYRRCLAGEVLREERDELVRADGSAQWIRWELHPWYEKGQIGGIAIFSEDVTAKEYAAEALRKSEQRYRTLFEENIAGVAIASEGIVVDCNEAWAQMLGFASADELRGRPGQDYYFDASDREPLLQELKEKGSARARELRLRCKDGSVIWVLFDCVIRPSEGGSPILQSTAIDITERKEAEGALRSSELRYRTLFEKTVAGVGIIGVDGRVVDCNDAWARMFGHKNASECLGGTITQCYRDPEQRKVLLAELKETGAFLNREWELCRHDGSSFWVLLNSVLITGEDGEPLIQSTMFEITKRKRAEDSLRRSEEHFRILVEQASDGIFIADQQGRYLDVNSAGAEMLGYSREEVLNRCIPDVVVKEEAERVMQERAQLANGQPVRNEWRFRRKDGSVFPGEVSARRLPDGRLQGILRDITERKRAEEILRQSEQRFRVALQDSPITVFNQDAELRYTWMYNPQLFWRQEILGKTDDELIGPRKAAALNQLKRRVLESGSGAREEIAIPYDGASKAFDITVEPLFDEQKNVIGITAACMDIARLREMADRLQESRDRLADEKSYLESEIRAELGFENIIGQSSALRDVLTKARIVAPTDSTVLLLGETGTGKELVARSVHRLSGRCANNFIKLNCAAVPSGLLESELFGHEKGAFTGAVSQKIGRIELADKGTLFLDEIGELPPELQPKLLRVLQDREFERLGGVKTLRVDVRIISATNRDLWQDIADKRFREDLFYRLNVFPIALPPLRERRDDIQMLVQHFVAKHAGRMGKPIEHIPQETMHILCNWGWPGNVRELENMIERMVILTKGATLAAPPAELSIVESATDDNLTEMEREHVLRVLRETNGVLSGSEGAASRLGLKRTTLQSMIKRLGIEPQEYRGRGYGTFGRP